MDRDGRIGIFDHSYSMLHRIGHTQCGLQLKSEAGNSKLFFQRFAMVVSNIGILDHSCGVGEHGEQPKNVLIL